VLCGRLDRGKTIVGKQPRVASGNRAIGGEHDRPMCGQSEGRAAGRMESSAAGEMTRVGPEGELNPSRLRAQRTRHTPLGHYPSPRNRREAHEVWPNVLPLPLRRWQPGPPEGCPGPDPTRVPAPGTQGPPATGESPPKTRRGPRYRSSGGVSRGEGAPAGLRRGPVSAGTGKGGEKARPGRREGGRPRPGRVGPKLAPRPLGVVNCRRRHFKSLRQ
jgi:hypothetical protein